MHYIIRKPDGGFVPPNARMHIARVAHLELKIPYTYHSLRHTHATMLAENGFSQLYTKTRLGHKSFAVTENTIFTLLTKRDYRSSTNLMNFFQKSDYD